jgi:hypothetical protein
VVTDSEATEATPQAEATEEQEFYVEESSDNQETSRKSEMTQAQAYAAFQKKKEQSAKRKKELEEAERREAEKDKRIAALEEQVGKITKGKPPTLEQFDYDEERFQKAAREYYSGRNVTTTKQEKAEQEQVKSPVNDEAEFYLYQKEQELSKAIPAYDDAKNSLINSLKERGFTNTNGALTFLSEISRQKGLDVAKVIFAMSKSPKIIDAVNAAGNNSFAVADILADAEKRVKTRSKKKIDSQPEPDIKSSGAIDNHQKLTAKAKAKWMEDGSIKSFNEYKAAKKAAKT